MKELQILIFVLSKLCLGEGTMTKKFVLQNEMSEHCRRRVVPSVFLGRQVADSSAEVMHFSRLDLPYSCSISVRTQSGSNIILVILIESDKGITRACAEGHDQLLVYEMGETFGGYWAALPESVFRQETGKQTTYYTLQTPTYTKGILEESDEEDSDYTTGNDEDIVTLTTQTEVSEDGYVVTEVPLVNISGNMQFGKTESTTSSNEDELFDLIYDVTPKNGVLYDTSDIPLVQFSIWRQNGQKEYPDETEPRYALDYSVVGFTPDSRLMFPTNNHRRKISNRPYFSTRRIKFKKRNKYLFAVHNWKSGKHPHIESITKLMTTPSLDEVNPTDFTSHQNGNETWKIIESQLNLLSKTSTTFSENLDAEALALLKRISDMRHNASVYLQTNLSEFYDGYSSMGDIKNSDTKIIANKYFTRSFLTTTSSSSSTTISLRSVNLHLEGNSTNILNLTTETSTTEINIDSDSKTIEKLPQDSTNTILPSTIKQNENTGNQSTTLLQNTLKEMIREGPTEKLESGSLVDHESWENIVQVAPVMADLLNVTKELTPNNTRNITKKFTEQTSDRPRNKTNRKKRYIQALSVAREGPRQITTKKHAPKPKLSIEQFDSQSLAEFVELQDDEIQGRVALHYYKNYVGPTIYNICDSNEPNARQVFLFNSSRIIIAVSNFTMNRITLVMTESRRARGAGCPPAHLECQVSGQRVCVHTMNACDGIPNCGTYDIYDEDRLTCGRGAGFHYTVWLAACTVLLVLLTLLYSVHYWLKRCVPNVSQAFFLYTDKSENILYLSSIMRSPNDVDVGSQLAYRSSLYSDDNLHLSSESMNDEDGRCMNIMRRCLKFLLCKKSKLHPTEDKHQEDPSYSTGTEMKRKFSYTEAQLRKIAPTTTRSISIQTGESLEIAHFRQMKSYSFDASLKQCILMSRADSVTDNNKLQIKEREKELSSLRQIRVISSTLLNSNIVSFKKVEQNARDMEEEIELRSTLYDRSNKKHATRQTLNRTNYDIHPEPPEQKSPTAKHLRFEEEATTIPTETELHYEDDTSGPERHRIHIKSERFANVDLNTVEEYEEAASTSGRDFMRFWGKGKKNKKKTQSSLR